MQVYKNGDGSVSLDLAGEEDRIGIFKPPRHSGPVIELYDGLAEELMKALRALLEKKPCRAPGPHRPGHP